MCVCGRVVTRPLAIANGWFFVIFFGGGLDKIKIHTALVWLPPSLLWAVGILDLDLDFGVPSLSLALPLGSRLLACLSLSAWALPCVWLRLFSVMPRGSDELLCGCKVA